MAGLERIGVFGGTYDPPHIGHLALAGEALHQLDLACVLWLLTPNPPHKRGQVITPLAERLEMLQAALANNPNFEVSLIELERPAPHYASDTMRILRERYPNSLLYYLMGSDSLDDLPTWYAPQEFLAGCDALGVMQRQGRLVDLTVLETLLPGISKKVQFVQAPLLEISSSDIRARIKENRPFRYYLPQKVYEIICAHGLYKS